MLFIYSFVLSSLLQWLGVNVISQLSGNANLGKLAVVFPWYISCTGKNSPASVAQNTAVIWRLSFSPANSTLLDPFYSMVHCDPGTILIPVWSQLNTSSLGTFSISTTAFISRRYCSLSSSK